MSRLVKVEFYRFCHSMEIMKYVLFACIGSFGICIFDFMSSGKELTPDIVFKTSHFAFFYILIFTICIIGIYIGREYKEKTIYYEYMRGYHPFEILGAKISTCGIVISIAIIIMTCVYLCVFGVPIDFKVIGQLMLMFLIVMHWCCGTIIYIMIMRSGILGGVIAFVRYVLFEGVANTLLLLFPANVRKGLALYVTLDQCASVTAGNISVPGTIAIIVSLIAEIVVLTIIYGYVNKKKDFA